MAGRKGNLLPPISLVLTVSPGILEYLKQAVATELYGRNTQEAAVRLIEMGLERLIDEKKIGPVLRTPLKEIEGEE
jgi:hypothetical protein